MVDCSLQLLGSSHPESFKLAKRATGEAEALQLVKLLQQPCDWHPFAHGETEAVSNKVLDVDGVKVKLQMWDTAGQERFRSVTHAYYRDAHALLLLYDVTNKASFDNIQAWLAEIHEYAQHDVALMLLGNKVDSAHERVVKREDGEKLAKVSQGRGVVRGCPWRPRAWAVPARPPPGWQQLFTGVWAALHGDQRQDGPQRGLGLHSHSKGVEAALHENSQRATLPAARLC
ncbi:ras-related protein Rab-26 isoform X5 [Papio anubis]|uniref:ras-related protein Rab-26 isoform X5 n=1 Tax=Papio anubis TaxID=9555 RepID=UPI000B7B86B7|nr:ras-related protein Rab-26 isoform X5 [Papio anubis]